MVSFFVLRFFFFAILPSFFLFLILQSCILFGAVLFSFILSLIVRHLLLLFFSSLLRLLVLLSSFLPFLLRLLSLLFDCVWLISVVPPLFPARETESDKFFPSVFTVTHLNGDIGRSGIALGYGDPCYLVDERGCVWNNKTGLTSSYIGPRPRGWNGEMCI